MLEKAQPAAGQNLLSLLRRLIAHPSLTSGTGCAAASRRRDRPGAEFEEEAGDRRANHGKGRQEPALPLQRFSAVSALVSPRFLSGKRAIG